MMNLKSTSAVAAAVVSLAALAGCSHDSPPDAANVPPTTTSGSASASTTTSTTTTQTTATTPAATTAGAATTGAGASSLAIDGPAPSFDVTDQDGQHLQLEALRGHNVVLYFYPKDETPGCTKEACSLRDSWTALTNAGVILIGVSADSDASHKAFAKNHQLPFHLVSDPQGKLAATYGVPFTTYTERQSIVIGPAGTVRRVFRKVDVSTHAQELLAVVKG